MIQGWSGFWEVRTEGYAAIIGDVSVAIGMVCGQVFEDGVGSAACNDIIEHE